MAIVLSCLILGQALGSMIAGSLADLHGHQGAFGLATAGGVISLVVTVLVMRGRWYERDPRASEVPVTKDTEVSAG